MARWRMRRTLVAGLVLLVALLGGTASSAQPGRDGSGACSPGVHVLQVGSGRRALMRISPGAEGGKMALVLVLHAAGGSPEDSYSSHQPRAALPGASASDEETIFRPSTMRSHRRSHAARSTARASASAASPTARRTRSRSGCGMAASSARSSPSPRVGSKQERASGSPGSSSRTGRGTACILSPARATRSCRNCGGKATP